jgi:hypothetical protein
MASGEWLPHITFAPKVRKQLDDLFAPALTDHLGPADTSSAITRQLEDIAAMASAFASPETVASKIAIENRMRAARAMRQALDRPDLPADDMLAGQLMSRGWDARKFLEGLREGLTEYESALGAINKRLSARRGGRPADSRKHWLVEQTTRILTDAGVPVAGYEDGLWAKTLRILWPVVLDEPAPLELKPWFKSLKSRR